jgi:uncharacterized protein YjiS (DUF1127 family)
MEKQMSTVTIAHTGRLARAAWLVPFLVTAVTAPLSWLRRIRQRRELMGLLSQPDHFLKDVGLQRHDITREALKPFWAE